jgi:MFS family permease
VFVEMRVASHPFAPGHVIFDRGLAACYLTNFFCVAGQIAPLFFVPLYYQAVLGFSATQSGLLLIPPMIGAVTASICGGLVIRRTGRYYLVTVLSSALLLLSLAPLVTSALLRSVAGMTGGLVMVGLGAGSVITTTLVAMLANAALEDVAVVIACSYLFRSLGSSIGISTASAVLQQILRSQLDARLSSGDDAHRIEERVRESLDFIDQLPPLVAAQVRDSYRYATAAAFAPPLLFLVLALVSSFFIREKMIGK